MKRFNDSKITLLLVAFAAELLLTAESANADFTFGQPVNLGPVVNSSGYEAYPSLSSDGLSLYFDSGGDLFVTKRQTTNDNWGPPANLGPTLNSLQEDWAPHISADGLELYFTSKRAGGDINGRDDIWVARRATLGDEWGTPINVGPSINTDNWDTTPFLSQDGFTLYFTSGRYNEFHGWVATDLYITHRETKDAPWQQSVNMGPVINDYSFDYDPSISPDGRVLLFSSDRGVPSDNSDYTEAGWFDIWMTRRSAVESVWNRPVNIGSSINTAGVGDWSPSISRDGKTLFFASARPGGYGSLDIWQAAILPIVDFNYDGVVDMKDFSKLCRYWGQNQPSVDMGPTPFGDGIVDIQDVAVLAGYWLKEVQALPFGLVAYWRLDETEGSVAHDSARDKDGALHGEAVWQPAGGKVGGALEFDGVDDYVSMPFILDPAAGPFSVFAWVKGGATGQAIISQTGGVAGGSNWLGTDPSGGTLMTGLMSPQPALQAEVVITDGEWHEIGLVWDGSRRVLYADGVEVARDTRDFIRLASDGGLYFGAGKGLEAGSFWSGLIDDVRIYDRAITP